MRVGVEEAVDEDLLDDRPHERRPELARVEAGIAERLGIGDLDAVDELHRQHAAGRQLLVHDRDVDLLELRHRVGEPSGVIGLVPVVELLEDAGRELADDLPDAHPTSDGEALLGRLRQLLHDAEVCLGLGDDLGPLDLDRDERPVGERGAVDLRGRGGGERLLLDRRVGLLPAVGRAPP